MSLDLSTTHYFVLSYEGLDVFALEIIIYESIDKCTLFISKADTTGHFYERGLSMRDVTVAILRDLLRNYVRHDKKTRLCLFAKAEGQYLFPCSKENPRKHVISDGQLIKWWVAVVDGLADEFEPGAQAKLQMPGAHERDIMGYLSKAARMHWAAGDIFSSEKGNYQQAAVYHIPRFPDDPKRRFLDFLVGEKRIKSVSTQQFWLELQSRQEFRLGRAVGIIGVEGNLRSQVKRKSGTVPITYKMMEKLKDCCMCSNYSTKESAKDAHEVLGAMLPQSSKLTIQGQRKVHVLEKKVSETPSVNVLSTNLVRRKC
jgi:regulator of Ty1 transposition protein 109